MIIKIILICKFYFYFTRKRNKNSWVSLARFIESSRYLFSFLLVQNAIIILFNRLIPEKYHIPWND